MNIFSKYIDNHTIRTESGLRRLFRSLAKKTHPDTAKSVRAGEAFISLKKAYDESIERLRNNGQQRNEKRLLGRNECVGLFIDLLAGNFPVDPSIRDTYKSYRDRRERLNDGLNQLIKDRKDLFLRFEKELYELRGDSVVANYPYSTVSLRIES